MATKAIKDMTLVTALNDTDDMIVEDTAATKRVRWGTIKTLIRSYLGLTDISGMKLVTTLPSSPETSTVYLIKE